MPSCDKCGESFGNAGACASHEAHCDGASDSGGNSVPSRPGESASADHPPRSPPENTETAQRPAGGQQGQTAQKAQQAQPPANEQQQQQQQGQNLPAAESTMQVGLAAADVMDSLASNDPEERAAAQGQAIQAAGMAAAQLGQKYTEKKVSGIQRSKERAGETLEKAESYAECPECDGQIKELPPRGEEFDCPYCQAVLVS